jgi:hypothetical protein
MQSPILGQSYVARSTNAADSRMVNLFTEVVPSEGKTSGFLSRAPGLKFLQTIGGGPIRGVWAHQINGTSFYVVSGNTVYSVSALTNSATVIGMVSGTGPISIADNGVQVMFACNGPSYIYNQFTGVFSQISDPNFPGAKTVAYLDGYFIVNPPISNLIYVSNPLDGTTWNPLAFTSVDTSPDGIRGIVVDHRELWIMGSDAVEVWYDAGNYPFPLARIQGAFNEIGCAATFATCKMDNRVFWLGADARGQGIVYASNGYAAERISTHAIEWQIQKYARIDDAIAYTYQQEGHAFYVLTFPTGNSTWVYDASTRLWHERASWDGHQFNRHRSNCQCNWNGNIIVGDYQNGNIYALDTNTYADNGNTQRWLRSWRALPPNTNDLKRQAHHTLQVDMEYGVGLNTGQGSNPLIMLRWSDDGGHTWSNYHVTGIGAIGTSGKRGAIWRRLGMATKLRDRVYELTMTDPVKTTIMGAELDITPANVYPNG